MINMQVQCLMLLWVAWAVSCDDPRNTVLMMPPPLSHYCLEGEDCGKVGKYSGNGFLGSGDDEVRVSRMWEERGELVVWLVKFAWIRACVKAGLPDDPDYPGKNGNFTLNALLVLEDSVSMCH